MNAASPGGPVRFDPSLERLAPDEDETRAALMATMRSIAETTSRDYGRAVRSVHAKSHALLEGELTVLDGLPPELAQGVFARPATYPAVLRLSTNPGDVLDDAVSAPRGLALKVIGVEGARLPGAEDAVTQDFVMANSPTFAAPDAKAFLGSLKQLAATTDKAEWAKKLLSATLRGVESTIEAVGGKSALLSTMGGSPITHPLGDTYYSQVPLRYGDFIAKIALVPTSPNLTELAGDWVNTSNRPDALREVVRETIIEQGGAWDLRVQLNTDLDKMPVEDASVKWDEEVSPYQTVGRITVAPQLSMGTDLARQVDEQTFFSPWHGLLAHQPLGSVNRARRQAYEKSADFRARFNGCPMQDTQAFASGQ